VGAADDAKPATSKYTVFRAFRNNYSGRARIFLALIAPVFLFGGYYLVLFFTQKAVIDATAAGRARLLAAAELRTLVSTTALHARFALASTTAPFVAQELDAADRDLSRLASLLDAFAYGSPAEGLESALAASAAAHKLLLVNGCVTNTVDAAACANYGGQPCVFYYGAASCAQDPASTDTGVPVFSFGVVGTGLLPAVREFATAVGDVLRVRRAQLAVAVAAGAPLGAGASLDAGTGAAVDAFGAAYLPAGFGVLLGNMVDELKAQLLAYNAWTLATIVASSVLLVGSYAVIYAPILFNLDDEIKRTRFLLLLFPEDVARFVPAVGDAARLLLQGSAAAAR
jgi:hypothetical protein